MKYFSSYFLCGFALTFCFIGRAEAAEVQRWGGDIFYNGNYHLDSCQQQREFFKRLSTPKMKIVPECWLASDQYSTKLATLFVVHDYIPPAPGLVTARGASKIVFTDYSQCRESERVVKMLTSASNGVLADAFCERKVNRRTDDVIWTFKTFFQFTFTEENPMRLGGDE